MVSANARPTQLGQARPIHVGGTRSAATATGIRPTTAQGAGHASPHGPAARATSVPATRPDQHERRARSTAALDGQRDRQRAARRRSAPPRMQAAPACVGDVTQHRRRRCARLGSTMPSRSRSACTAISSAAPPVKPRSAAGEMKLASVPRRSAPIGQLHHADQQRDDERELDVAAGCPTAASGASIANSASELALVGPDITCRLEPNSAATDARHHRGVEPVLRRQPGEGGERDALRQHQQRAEQAGERVGAQRVARHLADPVAQHSGQDRRAAEGIGVQGHAAAGDSGRVGTRGRRAARS